MFVRNDPFKNFDRNFKIMSYVINTFIAFTFILILCGFGFVGWALTHPTAVAKYQGHYYGTMVREGVNTFNEGN